MRTLTRSQQHLQLFRSWLISVMSGQLRQPLGAANALWSSWRRPHWVRTLDCALAAPRDHGLNWTCRPKVAMVSAREHVLIQLCRQPWTASEKCSPISQPPHCS